MIASTIYQRNNDLMLSKGDPQGIYLWNWHYVGSEIAVKYQLAYQTIEMTGKQDQEEQRDGSLKIADDRTLIFQGKIFRKEPRLDVSVEKDLPGILVPQKQPSEKSK